MICFPNCKINLGLSVIRRRSDGYHDLETVFYPLLVRDVLEVVPAESTQMHLSGLSVAGDSADNLVMKAWNLLRQRFPDRIPELDIYLHKVIPMGAGLGGGSADGAFMLRLLNDYCGLALTDAILCELALQLGSDCPFFIYNRPQFAKGRGELMQELRLDLSGYSIQLICPQVHVSTAKAFSMIKPRPASFDLSLLPMLPLADWKANVVNDFEPPVFVQHPELAHIKQQLYDSGAIYASMTGTGSTLYGIFQKKMKAAIKADVVFKEFYIE